MMGKGGVRLGSKLTAREPGKSPCQARGVAKFDMELRGNSRRIKQNSDPFKGFDLLGARGMLEIERRKLMPLMVRAGGVRGKGACTGPVRSCLYAL